MSRIKLCFGDSVGLAIWSLLLATEGTVGGDKSSVVLGSSSGSAGLSLLLLLGLDLWCLSLDLTGSRQRTVDLTTEKLAGDLDRLVLGEGGELEWSAVDGELKLLWVGLLSLADDCHQSFLGGWLLDGHVAGASHENHDGVYFFGIFSSRMLWICKNWM